MAEVIVFVDRIVGPYDDGTAQSILDRYLRVMNTTGRVLPIVSPVDAELTAAHLDYLDL